MRLPRCFDRLSNLVTALRLHAWAVGLSYHGSRTIHLRVANAGIQALRAKNHPIIPLMYPLQTIQEKGAANPWPPLSKGIRLSSKQHPDNFYYQGYCTYNGRIY